MTNNATESFSHETVLLNETVEGVLAGSGVYVDCTFGRGGHSRLLLSKLDDQSTLVVFDKDPRAIESANALAAEDARVVVIQDGFAQLKLQLTKLGYYGQVAGIMADLGVSSPQLDDASRGFSFQSDGPLDMRMNPDEGDSAAVWLANVSETALANVIYQYGEEHYSRRIAKAIVAARAEQAIETTAQLAQIVKTAHPKWDHKKHPATKTFQAIRIFINGELTELDALLADSVDGLKKGGRLSVISFHSLEDRAVKQFMKLQAKGPELPPGLPIQDDQIDRTMKLVGKAIKASKAEVAVNKRSRSAVLRVAERLA